MRKNLFVSSLSAIVLVLSVSAAHRQDPPDMQEYIQKIRTDGVSEHAYTELYTISSVLLGQNMFYFHKVDSTGRLWPGLMSTTCRNPNADPSEEAVEERRLKTEVESLTIRLKPFADSDGSGFVSTREARSFRELLEFGALAAHVVETGGVTLKAIAKASGLAEKDVDEKLSAYRHLADRMARASMKPLPAVKLQ